jgi:hypothetical protein
MHESFDFWKRSGFSDAGAWAMVAAEERESGGFNPAARGDYDKYGNPTAHGSFQWHGPRRSALWNDPRVGINVSTASHLEQLQAAEAEMRLGIDPQAGAAYEGLKNATDPRAASSLVVNGFLRPEDRAGAIASDLARAARLQRDYARSGAVPPSGPAPNSIEEMERRRHLPPGTLPRVSLPGLNLPGIDVGGGITGMPTPMPDAFAPVTPTRMHLGGIAAPQPERRMGDADRDLGPVTAPILDVPPLGAPANNNTVSNNSTVAPVLNQTTTIHLTGSAEHGRSVLEAQQGVNERLVRNMSSAVR